MAKRASQKTTWTKGELSPELYERTDLTHYYNAAKSMRNVRVLPQGGFTRRGGTWASKARRRRQRRRRGERSRCLVRRLAVG